MRRVVRPSHPHPQPALLLCHTASHEGITNNFYATILSIVVGQTVRRSTLTTKFVSSSRQLSQFSFCGFVERLGFAVIFSSVSSMSSFYRLLCDPTCSALIMLRFVNISYCTFPYQVTTHCCT